MFTVDSLFDEMKDKLIEVDEHGSLSVKKVVEQRLDFYGEFINVLFTVDPKVSHKCHIMSMMLAEGKGMKEKGFINQYKTELA